MFFLGYTCCKLRKEPSGMNNREQHDQHTCSTLRCVVIDFQCFKNNSNEFIIKEVSIIDTTSGCLLIHNIARPPFSIRTLKQEKIREVNWLVINHHGIEWCDGNIDYDVLLCIIKSILATASTILVKGCEKTKFIQTLVPGCCSVLDLETLGCGSLKFLNDLYFNDALRCKHHKCITHVCSLTNTINMRRWYLDYNKKNEE